MLCFPILALSLYKFSTWRNNVANTNKENDKTVAMHIPAKQFKLL